jgi:hypothetical protein
VVRPLNPQLRTDAPKTGTAASCYSAVFTQNVVFLEFHAHFCGAGWRTRLFRRAAISSRWRQCNGQNACCENRKINLTKSRARFSDGKMAGKYIWTQKNIAVNQTFVDTGSNGVGVKGSTACQGFANR